MRTDKEQLLRLRIAAERKTKERDFWLGRLSGELVKSSFPAYYNYKRERTEAGAKANASLNFPDKLSAGLLKLGAGSDIRLYIILAASLTILINKYTGCNDIIVGTAVLKSDIKPNLLNTVLALRNQLTDNMTVKELLLEVRQTILEANKNRNYPIEVLTEQLNLPLRVDDFPLFDVAIVVENVHDKEHLRHVNPNMVFSFLRTGEAITGYVEYNPLLYDELGVKRIIDHFINLLGVVIKNVNIKTVEIEILTGEEKKQLLIDFNDTFAEYPRGKTIHELFEEQAERTPDGAAVVGARGTVPLAMHHITITYKELNRKSDELAHVLRDKGVGPDSIVGIMVYRSIEMIVGILGILKAGGGYLPIDPDYPQQRIRYMIADSAAKVLVITNTLAGEIEKLRSWEVEKVFLEEVLETPESSSQPLNLSTSQLLSTSSLAYIIYTSGTTGKPKGVMVEHRSVVNLLLSLQRDYPFLESDAYLLKTSYLFDVSVSELFGWYPGGGQLVVLEPEGHKDPAKIIDALQRHGITHINFVPSMFAAFVEYLHYHEIDQLGNLKYIFLAGEALLSELVNRFRRLNTDILVENLYGPTEAAVYASRYPLSLWDGVGNVPIGKPLSNVQLYILARNSRLQPVGVPGELCIAGDGISRGYLNCPELTAEKFLFDSYKSNRTYRTYFSKKLYKTGDLARWLPDGNIEFLGRMDHQVKIRGFRIELGEIENQLIKHPDIGAVVVVAASRSSETEGKEDRYLCAYVVPAAGAEEKMPDSRELKEFLIRMLPDYMVPSFFVPMGKIPLTGSGKLDRKALPAPETVIPGVEYTAPRDTVEAKLAEIWSNVLNVERIGIDDNFFELGGHSLKATALAARIYKTFNVNVTLANLFKNPTIRRLGEFIKRDTMEEFASIEPVEEKDYYLLTPAQKRIYILQQSDRHDMSYNMPQVIELEGELEKGRLEATFKKLTARHESFRTSFETQKGELIQRVNDHIEFEVERLAAAADKDNIAGIIHSFVRPFDLSQPPLLRVGLINVDKGRHILIVDMHHIITDGSSMGIFVREFMALQADKELPSLRVQYKDFSVWMNSKSMKESIEKQEEYWLNEFEGEIPVLQLYTDDPGLYLSSPPSSPGQWSLEGKQMSFEPENTAAEGLKALAKEEGTTLYMVLLAIYNILLSKLSGQEDIVVGTVTAGRTHPDLQPIIGMFVNTLALRNYPGRETTFSEFLKEVKARTLEAFENQAYPFEELAENVAADRDSRRNPLFDVMFTQQNLDIPEVEIPGLTLKPYAYENVMSKFDLALFGVEEDNKLLFIFEYRTQRFNERIISEFVSYFKEIIAVVLKDRDVKLADIELSSDLSDSEAEAKVYQEAFGDFKF